MIVGELGCRRCRNVVEMGRTPNGDNMSEKREVQAKRINLSEVRTVGEMGCRRSEWTPLCSHVQNRRIGVKKRSENRSTPLLKVEWSDSYRLGNYPC